MRSLLIVHSVDEIVCHRIWMPEERGPTTQWISESARLDFCTGKGRCHRTQKSRPVISDGAF